MRLIPASRYSVADHPTAIIQAVKGGIEVSVKVVPGASRDRLAGALGDALKVQVSAPPERGRANAAVTALLAAALGVSGNVVEVVRGKSGTRKWVRVRGVTIEAARARLGVT